MPAGGILRNKSTSGKMQKTEFPLRKSDLPFQTESSQFHSFPENDIKLHSPLHIQQTHRYMSLQ